MFASRAYARTALSCNLLGTMCLYSFRFKQHYLASGRLTTSHGRTSLRTSNRPKHPYSALREQSASHAAPRCCLPPAPDLLHRPERRKAGSIASRRSIATYVNALLRTLEPKDSCYRSVPAPSISFQRNVLPALTPRVGTLGSGSFRNRD